MADTRIIDLPPRFPLCERARDLVANIEAGGRGDWRQGEGLQSRSVLYRAQAAREYADEPNPLLRGALISARILALVPVTIDPLHLFAANGIMPTVAEDERREAYAYLATQPPLQGHSHHISMDYAKLIRLGVRGVLAEIDEYESQLGTGPAADERRTFYQALRIALQGLLRYGQRYREEALRLLAEETDPVRRAELERIVAALARVPYEPAETFFEAIQSFLLLHFGSRTQEMDSAVGRFDYYMDAYYRADLAAGRITRAEAAAWVRMLLAHLLELTRFSDCIVVAGSYPDGVTPFYNDLTCFVLDGMAALQIPNPEIGFRYVPGQPRELLRRAAACVQAGTGHPGFFNDPVAIAALERAGMTREQAADYANCNCIELTSAGRSSIVSGYAYLNLAKLVEHLLNGGAPMLEEPAQWGAWRTPAPPPEMPQTFATFEALLDAYEQYVDYVVDHAVHTTDAWMRRMDQATLMPLSSAFIEGCIARGKHAMLGGAVCSQTFPTLVGFVNAVDALVAIRQAVFEEHLVTLDELAAACRDDFAGREPLQQYLLKQCPKYGNGDPDVDALARRLFLHIADRFSRYHNIYGQAYGPQYMGWITHAVKGRHTAATPDGRHAGETVSGSLGGDHGTDTHGPTALLRSAAGLHQMLASGGVAVNLALSPSVLRTDEDVEHLIDLTLTYFALGGMQIQYNCVSADTLREAQRHPDAHRHLLVRVAGYSDRFVCLDRNLQDEIISRTEHGLG